MTVKWRHFSAAVLSSTGFNAYTGSRLDPGSLALVIPASAVVRDLLVVAENIRPIFEHASPLLHCSLDVTSDWRFPQHVEWDSE